MNEIPEKMLKETEEKLRTYYKRVKRMNVLKLDIKMLNEQIEKLESDIQNINVHLEPELNMGLDYSRDRIQTSSQGSYVEKETERQCESYERMIKERERIIKADESELMELKKDTAKMKATLDEPPALKEEFQDLLYSYYAEEKTLNDIALKMHIDTSTASRLKDKIVSNVASWCNLIT